MKNQTVFIQFCLSFFLFTSVISSSFSQSNDSEIEVLIPLYQLPYTVYGGTFHWQPIVDAQSKVKINAIINPDSGPTNDSDTKQNFTIGIKRLNDANVKVYGYVSTGYINSLKYKGGSLNNPNATATVNRNTIIQAIKSEIDLYRSQTLEANSYSLDGIFFDEVSALTTDLATYVDLYNYVKSPTTGNASWKVILNPGQGTIPNYFNSDNRAGDIVVKFENDFSVFGNLGFNQSNPEQYSLMVYSNNNPSVRFGDFRHVHFRAKERKYKYIYVTDDVYYKPVNEGTTANPNWVTRDHNGNILSGEALNNNNPYDQLPNFWKESINYIQWHNYPIKSYQEKDFINTLIYNNWRNEQDANSMSQSNRRNTIIVEMNLHSNHSISFFQGLHDHDLISGAVVVSVLLQKHGYTKAQLSSKNTVQHRSLLINELMTKTGKSFQELDLMTAFQLAKF